MPLILRRRYQALTDLKNAVYRGIHGIITAMVQWETYLTIFFFREDVVAWEVVEESVNVASE